MLTSHCALLIGRKRKHDEMSAEETKEESKFVAAHTTTPPCKVNGLRGIYNAGATCYQNVVLQCFLHNPFIRNFYLSDGHTAHDCGVLNCISCAMDDMFQDFWGVESTNGYTAANVLSGFWFSEKKAFENLVTTREQDAHEFFQFLAEELHERNTDAAFTKEFRAAIRGDDDDDDDADGYDELPPSRSVLPRAHSSASAHGIPCRCIIHQTFYGRSQTTTTCQHCSNTTQTTQMFLDINLGVESMVQKRKRDGKKAPVLTLRECLDDEYVKSEKCEYRCPSCDTVQQARRSTSIRTLPNVLCIQLKVSRLAVW